MRDFSKQPLPILTIKQFYDEKEIILNPRYQRNEVWTRSQKQYLVDSLLIGIDIPKIYFNRKNEKYEVVDGQQRIRAILEFLEDKFELPDESPDELAKRTYSQLPLKTRTYLHSIPIDVVILKDWSDDDIEGMFLRLQDGTPLNSPEKRRAIPGNFKDIIKDLGDNKIFLIAEFKNIRFGYEDASAKILHLALQGSYTVITPAAIKRTYVNNKNISDNDSAVKEVKASMNFVRSSFKAADINPKLKKWSVITLVMVAKELLKKYDIQNYKSEFATTFCDFELHRVKNSELAEEKQDSKLTAFTDAVRGDDPAKMEYRHRVLLETIVARIPTLEPKDRTRAFTQEQRVAIYFKDKGICQNCKKKVDQDDDYESDHIKPWSKGGKTTVSNGQVLCGDCNQKKSNKQ